MRKILSVLTVLLFVLVLVACGSKSFTVTFNTNEGSEIAAIEVEEGQTFDAPTAPTRSGFVFDGWYKESALTNMWDFETDVVESNITLYAKWSAAGLTDQEKVDAAHTALTLPDLTNLTNSSPRLILPTSGANSVTITWAINKLEYIAANGVITQPTHEEGDQTVTLTATIVSGTVNRTKAFTATVKALPSLEETEPLINETFDYTLGNILEQTTPWGPVSGKSGNSVFTIVDTITGMSIPDDSNALKIEAFLELQVEAPIVHAYDLVVFEVDLMQTASSNGSAINIQSSSSSPVVAFGLDGASLFYRTDNGSLIKTNINVNQWYTLRAEVNLAAKTMEVFYYEDGQLISLTPGPVAFTGTTPLQSLFIRSGSSNTTELKAPAYVTNIVANRIEALPRPVEEIKLGEVMGIEANVSIEEDQTFTPDTPMIHNYYGNQRELVLTTEYTLAIDNPVDTSIPGDYTVTYTFTNVSDSTDTKVVTQAVNVYAVSEPNEILTATATATTYPARLSDITLTVVQPLGNLFYLLSDNATENETAILAGTSVAITNATITIEDLNVGENLYIHFIVELNGNSNIFSLALTHQEVVEISTAQQFYDAVQTNSSSKYFLLTADIDMTGFVWADASFANKLTSVFDGDGFTVSNLTLTKSAKGGIFADVDGGTIKDIVFDNVHMTAAAGVSALLVGESRGVSVIENVVITNSSSVGNADYAALLVSRVRNGSLRISNLSIVDSNVEGKKDYAGGIVAGMDAGSSIIFEDIYLNNFELLEATADTGQMAGIIIGRIQGNVEMKRIVAIDIFVRGIKNIGGLIGKSDEPGTTVTLTDIYLEGAVEKLDVASNNYGSIAANHADQTPTLANVWVSGFMEVGSLSLDVAPEFKVAFATIQNQPWWTTNLSAIATNSLWAFGTNGVFELVSFQENSKPMVEVTLDYNFDIPNEVIQIRQDNEFSHGAPLVPGYNFVGWYTDVELLTALPTGYVITVPVTLYGKYETVPASTVSFVTNVVDVTVPSQEVNYGELATAPVVADQMIEGVLKEVTGWTLNGTPFSFTTEIIANIELVAVWETKEYQVTFDGADAVTVSYGELVTEPAVDPVHIFVELVFNAWQLGGVNYDFSTPVTSNINLVSSYSDPVASLSITTLEQFYYMATVANSYPFALANDLDFTGFTWVQSGNGTQFSGVLNGTGYTVSNITITGSGTGVYGGIFQRTNGATIQNITFDNINVNVAGRVGVLIGRVESATTTITNVTIQNSSATGTVGEGVGIVIGNASTGFVITNLKVISSTALNSNKNVAFIAGRSDGAATLTDVYIYGSTAESTNLSTDAGVGGIIGYTNNANSAVTLTRVVIEDSILKGRAAGSLVGYYRFGDLTATDVFTDIEFIYADTNGQHGVIGRRNVDANTTEPLLTNIFAHYITQQPGAAVQLEPAYVLADLTGLDQIWWTNNFSGLTGNTDWGYDSVSKFYRLV